MAFCRTGALQTRAWGHHRFHVLHGLSVFSGDHVRLFHYASLRPALPVSPGSLFMLQRDVVPMISVNEYFDLILLILLGMGLMFELPVLIFFLSLFGIVTPKFLWRNFRYAILIIAIVAAIVTPTPDA